MTSDKYISLWKTYVETKFLLGYKYAELNFAQKSKFPGFKFFNEPKNLQTHSLKSKLEARCSGLLRPVWPSGKCVSLLTMKLRV